MTFSHFAGAQNISDKVNTHLKDTQWRIDFEREVRTNETMALPAPKNLKTPAQKRPASTFGVMNHEENSHFNARPSFDPKNSPSIGNNLNSWAEHTVEGYRKSQELSTDRQVEWMKNLIINARAQGYEVKIDKATMQVQLVPLKKTKAKPSRSTAADNKPVPPPAGF